MKKNKPVETADKPTQLEMLLSYRQEIAELDPVLERLSRDDDFVQFELLEIRREKLVEAILRVLTSISKSQNHEVV